MILAEQLTIIQWAQARSLEEVAIELTGYCNLSCTMCSVWRVREHGLSFGQVVRILSEAHDMGARKLVPCGAECFVRRDFVDILECAATMGYTTIPIVTNGLLLTPETLDRLINLPQIFLNVSIDGPAAVHNALRGPNVFEKLQLILEEISSRNIQVGLSTVVMKQTLPTLVDIVDLAGRWGITSISLQPFQPEIAGAYVDAAEFSFQAAELDSIRDQLESVKQYADTKGVTIITESMLSLFPRYLALGERPIPPGGCFVPSRFCLIDIRGMVYPCFFMRDRPIGNINSDSLTALWRSRTRQELNELAIREQCPGCLAACSDLETYSQLYRSSGGPSDDTH